MEHSRRLTPALLLMSFLCAFSFGAIVRVAFANHYHVACVGNGFVHGDSTTDGSFYARVENGCGSNSRSCDLYVSGSYVGGLTVGATQCDAWSRDYGDYTECHGSAHVAFVPTFSDHTHFAHNWCG